jgi:glyoxylase-like metal-dependent hydrolase (beta-lactamase superfamily II)
MAAPLPPELLFIEPLSARFPHSCNSFAIWEEDGTWTWIDPGAAGDDNIARMKSELSRLGLPLDRLGRIFITHAHVDHLPAAGVLAREGIVVPIHIHGDALECARDLRALVDTFDFELIPTRFGDESLRARVEKYEMAIFQMGAPFVATSPEATLHDGDRIRIGPFEWECLHTHGHARGHVMLWEASHGLLIAGDVIGYSLAWHSPSSGGAAAYLASVERVAELGVKVLLPAHGAPTEEAAPLVAKMRRKLIEREERIVDALAGGPLRFGELYDRTTEDAERFRAFPYVPITVGHLERLAALGALREADGVIERA